jgi:hypothetical protein
LASSSYAVVNVAEEDQPDFRFRTRQFGKRRVHEGVQRGKPRRPNATFPLRSIATSRFRFPCRFRRFSCRRFRLC